MFATRYSSVGIEAIREWKCYEYTHWSSDDSKFVVHQREISRIVGDRWTLHRAWQVTARPRGQICTALNRTFPGEKSRLTNKMQAEPQNDICTAVEYLNFCFQTGSSATSKCSLYRKLSTKFHADTIEGSLPTVCNLHTCTLKTLFEGGVTDVEQSLI